MSDQLLTVLKFALLAVLYLFFVRVLRAVWAELREPKAPSPPPPVAHFAAPPTIAQPSRGSVAARPTPATSLAELQLVVVDPPETRGRTFPLGPGGEVDLTIGRAAGCGLALTEDTFVSQLHARLFRTDGSWYVEDLGSTNGTFLNRHKVSAPQALQTGDHIQVGRTVFEVSG